MALSFAPPPCGMVPIAAQIFDSYLPNFLWSFSFKTLSANVCYRISIRRCSKPYKSSRLSLFPSSSLIFLNHIPKSVLVCSKSLLSAFNSMSALYFYMNASTSKLMLVISPPPLGICMFLIIFLSSSISTSHYVALSSVATQAFVCSRDITLFLSSSMSSLFNSLCSTSD